MISQKSIIAFLEKKGYKITKKHPNGSITITGFGYDETYLSLTAAYRDKK